MSRIVTIRNVSGSEKTYAGQTIADTELYTLETGEYVQFKLDQALFADVSSGAALIGNGTSDITDPVRAWEWLQGDITNVNISQNIDQTSSNLNKLAVHSSPKPEPDGISTFAIWTGAGDDVELVGSPPSLKTPEETIGNGELMQFNMTNGTPQVIKDIKFDARHGRLWIHEAYLKFTGAGFGDWITADVVAPATPVQTFVNLDYNIVDDYLVYAGPGAGTHGLGGNPVLTERPFSKDGDWNFDGVNLTPNFEGTGAYKITTVERVVHRYINKIPLLESTSNYFTLTSHEAAELPVQLGYFLRITVNNGSNQNWTLSAIMEMYRERTFVP